MSQPYYDSDLTEEEWQQIEPLLPPEKPVGKEREVDLRFVLNGIFYRADNGIKWRALPSDFPAWLENARALTRDYETLPENHEGMIYVVMIRLMLRRLTNNRRTRKPQTT
jgi:transposase